MSDPVKAFALVGWTLTPYHLLCNPLGGDQDTDVTGSLGGSDNWGVGNLWFLGPQPEIMWHMG